MQSATPKYPMQHFQCFGANLYIIYNLREWKIFYAQLMRERIVAVDTETQGFDWFNGHRIVGMSFGWRDTHFYIPVRHEDSFTGGKQPDQINMDDIRDDLKRFFCRPDVSLLMHNCKFDKHFFKRDGLDITALTHDTRTIWHFFNENAPGRLKSIASGWRDDMSRWHKGLVSRDARDNEKEVDEWRDKEAKARRKAFGQLLKERAEECKHEIRFQGMNKVQIKKHLREHELANHELNVGKEDIHYGVVPIEVMGKYAALDTFYTYVIYEKCIKYIKDNNKLKKLYINELQLQNVLFDAEESGIHIDVEYLQNLGVEFDKRTESMADELRDLLYEHYENYALDSFLKTLEGESEERRAVLISRFSVPEINFNSVDHVSNAMLLAGVPLEDRTAAGKLSLDKKVLKKHTSNPIVQVYQNYKKLVKLKTAFVDGILKNQVNGIVHPSFNSNVKTGRMSVRNPNCFDDKTEILTRRGWILFEDLVEEDKVAQYSEGTIEFVTPLAYHAYPYKGDLLHITRDRHLDLMVTPDHRCYLETRRSNKKLLVPASEYKNDMLQRHGGLCFEGDLDLSPLEITVLCAIQADGNLRTDCDLIDFKFSKDRKISRLKSALQGLEVPFKESVSNHVTRITFKKLSVPNVFKFIDLSKTFSWDLLRLKASVRCLLCEELLYWDGTYTTKDSRSIKEYKSCNQLNVDIVQAIASISGFRCTKGAQKVENTTCYIAWFIEKTTSYSTNFKSNPVPYDGYVYCVSVPSEKILVRRSNKVIVSGNCQQIPRGDEIRSAFITPSDDYYYLLIDYSQIEIRLTAHFANDPTLIEAYMLMQDIHTRSGCEVFGYDYDEAVKVLKDPEHPDYKKVKNYRQVAKVVNFAIIYGAGPKGLSEQLPLPDEFKDKDPKEWVLECGRYIEAYLHKYHGVKRFVRKSQRFVKENSYSMNHFGRVRHLPHARATAITGDDSYKWMEGSAQRQGTNFIIQGTAADVFKIAAVRIHKILKGSKSRLVNFVHDEVQIYLHKDDLDLVHDIKAAMEDFDFKVPLIAEVTYSDTSWGKKKDWDVFDFDDSAFQDWLVEANLAYGGEL